MPVIRPEEMSEEARQEVIAEAVIGKTPSIPGVEIIRGISPLAMVALQRANNPYITSRKGFDAMGVEFVEKEVSGKVVMAPKNDSRFGVEMMQKTAEMLVVFSCDREMLKRFAVDSASLEDAALEMLDVLTTKQLEEATLVISEQLKKLSKSQATQDPEEEKPSAAALETASGKKKQRHTG